MTRRARAATLIAIALAGTLEALGQSGPIADAGPDRTASIAERVILDGGRSVDPNGGALTYRWSFLIRPEGSGATLFNPGAAITTFIVDVPGTYVLSLVVATGTQESAPDFVTITATNRAPFADAGPDVAARVGEDAVLDGAQSFDLDFDRLTYQWVVLVKPDCSRAILNGATSANAAFLVDCPGTFLVQLLVNDGIASGSDVVLVTTTNSAPVADAGPDSTAETGRTVRLDGSNSSDLDANPLTYTWSFASRPPGSTALLDDSHAVFPQFVPDLPGAYRVRLVVNDGLTSSSADTIIVSTINSAPMANAGRDQHASVGEFIHLDGSLSADADGQALRFSWRLVERPSNSGAALDDPTVVRPAFFVDASGTYSFQLVVNDGLVSSAADTIRVATGNVAPRADAGPDQTVQAGSVVRVSGVGSSDADGDELGYRWALTAQPPGSASILFNVQAVRPAFVPDRPGAYVLQLVVTDGSNISEPDSVLVTTGNTAPTADAGRDQTVPTEFSAILDGTQSRDANGDALTFRWTLVTRPITSRAQLVRDSAVTLLTADVPGIYVASLEVSDGTLTSRPDAVVITTGKSIPVADAGTEQDVRAGHLVTLDGTRSADADFDALAYRWSLLVRPSSSRAVLSDVASPTPTFTADAAGTYVAQLVVSDGTPSAPSTVLIVATNRVNHAPTANAGPDQTVVPGSVVQLDAAGSTDADGDTLTYKWTLKAPAGSTATLTDPTSATPTFVAEIRGVYTAQLVASDGEFSATDFVAVRANQQPAASIATALSVMIGDIVELDGRDSADPDGDPLTYLWTLAAPNGSHATLVNPQNPVATFVADIEGEYLVQLVVNDGLEASDPATARIVAIPRPNEGIVCGETTARTIVRSGERHEFTFTARANQAVVFAAVATAGSLAPVGDLYSPNNVLLFRTLPNRQSSSPLLLRIAGTYRIVVHDDNLVDTGSYNLSLQSSSGDCARAIACGATEGGVMPGGGNLTGLAHAQLDAFTFTAAQNDAVVFAAVATSGPIAPVADLYDPNGVLRFRTLPNRQSSSVVLPVAGAYTIVVHDDNLVDGGTYNLNMRSSTGACGRAMRCGDTLAGALPDPSNVTGFPQAQQDGYTFSGTQGEAVVFAAVATSGAIAPVADLFDTAGVLRFRTLPNRQSASIRLPATGTYTIVVHDDNLIDGGTYNVGLQFATGRCAVALQCGIYSNGTIPGADNASQLAPAEQDAFSFLGTAGEGVIIEVVAVDGTFAAIADLYDPAGVLRFRTLPNRPSPAILLPIAGRYTIVVHDDDLRDGGSYRVRYVRVGGCPGVPAATVTPGALDFGQQQVGTPSAPQTVTITSTGTAPLKITDIRKTSAHFQLQREAECMLSDLDPGKTCTFDVVFAPAAAGPFADTVVIDSDAFNGPHTVILAGQGTDCLLTPIPNPALWFSDVAGTGGSRGQFRFVRAVQGIPAGGSVLAGTVSPAHTSLVFEATLAESSAPVIWLGTRLLSPFARVASVTGAGWIPEDEQPGALRVGFVDALAGNGVDFAWLILESPLQAAQASKLFFVSLDTSLYTAGLAVVYNIVEFGAPDAQNGVSGAVLECAGVVCSALPAGAVAWWPGNGFAEDVMSPAQNGVLRNGAGFAPGKVDRAFSFDGLDDFVEVPDSPALHPAAVTVDAWVRFNDLDGALSGNAPPGLQYIVFKGNGQATNVDGFALMKVRTPEGDRFAFAATSAEGAQGAATSTTLIEPGRFYHAAGTFDGHELKLYVDGILESSVVHDHPLANSDGPLTIGRSDVPVFDGACNCLVDEVGVFNRALTAAEIGAIVASTSRGQCRDRAIVVTPGALSFAPQTVGMPSDSQIVTVTNVGTNVTTIDLVVGGTEFQVAGSSCGGVLPPGASCTFTVQFLPEAAGDRAGSISIVSDALGSPHVISASGNGASGTVDVDPPTLVFGELVQGTASAPFTAVLRNGHSAPISLLATSATGDFQIVANQCAERAVEAGGSCTISVMFVPALTYVVGERSGTLTIATTVITMEMPLTGTAIGIPELVAPRTADFGDVVQGTASAVQTIAVQNTGAVPLEIHGWTLTGEFVEDVTDCPRMHLGQGPLAAGASCGVGVRFAPALTYVTGARTGTLELTTNSGSTNGSVGTTHLITLSGNATGVPQAVLPAGPIAFGDVQQGSTSAPQSVTLLNAGAVPLVIHGWNTGGEFLVTSDCPLVHLGQGPLAAGASCALEVRFAPALVGTPGPRSGTLEITTNSGSAAGSIATTHVSALTGNAMARTEIELPPGPIDFGNVQVGTPASLLVTVRNIGVAPVQLTSVTATGDYSLLPSTCTVPGGTISAGGACSLRVSVTAMEEGLRTGTLTLTSIAGNSPHSVELRSTGVPAALSLTPSPLDFGSVQMGTASAQLITVRNIGVGPVQLTSVVASGDFSLLPSTCTVPGGTISAGGACSLRVSVTATEAGLRTGTLTLTSTAANSPHNVDLSATGVPAALSLTPSPLLDFGNVQVGTASSQLITVRNVGVGPVQLTSMAADGDFDLLPSTCTVPGGTISANGACSLRVIVTATGSGLRTGTLTLTSTAANSPHSMLLRATGVLAALSLTPSPLDFGNVEVGTAISQLITVRNIGVGPVQLTSVAATGDYSLLPSTCTVPDGTISAGGACSLRVTVTATESGLRTGTLTLASTAANTPHIVDLRANAATAVATVVAAGSSCSSGLCPKGADF